MASGVVYLVNFPDGSQQAFNRLGDADAEPAKGDEFPPEWIIDTIQLAKGGSYTPDGLPISYEVWVERTLPEDVEP